MKLPRPQRQRVIGVALVVGWLVAAYWVWAADRWTWTASRPGPVPTGDVTAEFGLIPWLELEALPVPLGGSAFDQGVTRTWRFRSGGLTFAICATLFFTVVAVSLYRHAVYAGRLIGRCDECGYDLTGLRSSVCPECGTPVGHHLTKRRAGQPNG